jgi:hypothetical protein
MEPTIRCNEFDRVLLGMALVRDARVLEGEIGEYRDGIEPQSI